MGKRNMNMVDNTVQFYTPDKQCPVCYESHGRFPMFPVQFSFNNNTKQFMLSTCGHPCCKKCTEKLVTITPDGDYIGKSCPVCRYPAQYFISVDIEKSLIEDFTKDNYALQCEVRQLALYTTTITKQLTEFKWAHLTQKLILSTQTIFNTTSSSSEDDYITDDEAFLDMQTDTDSDEHNMEDDRPITSRHHLRLQEQLQQLERDNAAVDLNDTIRDALMVIFQRLGKMHERLSELEMEQTATKLSELKRQYQLKKYETILLEKEILDIKQEYMTTRPQHENDQANA